jgi:ubiquitin carboxyl-terminal hydrolase 22/27/51
MTESKNASEIQVPIGMYNLGNTCFMTCILQCLIHCEPLQQHFLQDIGHHHKSCELIRSAYKKDDSTGLDKLMAARSTNEAFDKSNICLSCEMDKLFLQYFANSIGQDATRAVCQTSHPLDRYGKTGVQDETSNAYTCVLGEPLVTTKLLAAAWKSGGMDHLAGYEQGDAHEFLQAFLDTVGKHAGEYRKLLRYMQRMALPSFFPAEINAVSSQDAGMYHFVWLVSTLICSPRDLYSLLFPSKILSKDCSRVHFARC